MLTYTPLVSVHMITYNHERYIANAIEGVLIQQTGFDFELIIADDCSTDNTHSIIQHYINNHPMGNCIKYFPQTKNLGVMPNFSFALRQCKGKYIAVCEGDDYWIDPYKLQKQVAALEADLSVSMVITNRKVLNEGNLFVDELYNIDCKKSNFCIADVVGGFVPGMQTILVRNYASLTDFLDAHPEFYYGDRYLAYFASLFGTILLLPDITAVYRLTGNGAWSANAPIEKLHTYTKFMDDFHSSLGIPFNNDILAKFAFDSSYTTLRYCFKRPKQFLSSSYRKSIVNPWKKFNKMNRLKIIISVFFNRK
jgi:glycosyltransferase involved in cell wall biosynthesis